MLCNWFSLQFLQPTKIFRRLQTNYNTYNAWSTSGLVFAQNLNTNCHMELRNTWWVHAGGNLNELSPTFDDRVARGDPAVRRSRSLNWNTGIEFDRRKWYTPVIFAGHSSGDEGRSHS